jgi:hypothetical protein
VSAKLHNTCRGLSGLRVSACATDYCKPLRTQAGAVPHLRLGSQLDPAAAHRYLNRTETEALIKPEVAMWYGTLGPALLSLCLVGPLAANAIDAQSDDAKRVSDSDLEFAARCPSLEIEIVASSAEERHLACSAAATALRLLDRCSIGLQRRMRVEILSEVRHPFSGPILGMFDTARERVLVAREGSISALTKDTPYANLPLREFYKSLIVHEVVHGVMHQNLTRKPTTHAAYEYPAYALQLESLPPEVRESFLRSFDQAALGSNSLFSDPVLFFDPYFFAARAYLHYRAAPDVCTRLTSLLSDEVAFIAPPM